MSVVLVGVCGAEMAGRLEHVEGGDWGCVEVWECKERVQWAKFQCSKIHIY